MPNSKDIIGNKPNLPPSEEVRPLPQTPLPAVNALSADPQARNPYFTEPLPSVGTPADPDQLRNFLRAGVSQYRTTPPPIVPSSTSTAVSVSTIAQTVVDNTVSSSVIPLTILKAGHEWLDSFSSASGLFTQSQPSFSDISGTLINSQLPTSGVVAGSYTAANLTVNAQGIVTAASNGSGGGVTSLNSETGAVTLVAGTNVTITPSGQNITISSSGGGGSNTIEVNGLGLSGSPPATIANFNTTTPAAPAGNQNVTWQESNGSISAHMPVYAPSDTPHTVPGLSVWLSADNITGLVDGASVVSWPDLAVSNGGEAASEQHSSTSAVYKTNIVNGKPIVRFSGSCWFKLLSPFDRPEFTFAMVLKVSSLSNAYTAVLKSPYTPYASGSGFGFDQHGYFVKSSGKTAMYIMSVASSGTWSTSNYDGTGSATLNNTTFYVVSGIVGPQAASTRVALSADGSIASLTNTNISAEKYIILGNDLGNSGRTMTGDVAELLMYNHALSSADLSTVENYLKTKYGL